MKLHPEQTPDEGLRGQEWEVTLVDRFVVDPDD